MLRLVFSLAEFLIVVRYDFNSKTFIGSAGGGSQIPGGAGSQYPGKLTQSLSYNIT